MGFTTTRVVDAFRSFAKDERVTALLLGAAGLCLLLITAGYALSAPGDARIAVFGILSVVLLTLGALTGKKAFKRRS